MTNDVRRLCEDLSRIGLEAGDCVMVHASYKATGGVEGGIPTVLEALKTVIGTSGTLMLPTFTYDSVNRQNPIFDVRYTASCVGMIPEDFRHQEGVVRSLHPTHSVAVWGKDNREIIADHREDNVCVGPHSPFIRLKDRGGKILMIGCGTAHNTLIHGAECFVRAPYAFRVDYSLPEFHRDYACVDENDHITRREFFHEYMEPFGYDQDYTKLRALMPMNEGTILKAESFLMDARLVWETVLNKMKEDPYYFVRKRI